MFQLNGKSKLHVLLSSCKINCARISLEHLLRWIKRYYQFPRIDWRYIHCPSLDSSPKFQILKLNFILELATISWDLVCPVQIRKSIQLTEFLDNHCFPPVITSCRYNRAFSRWNIVGPIFFQSPGRPKSTFRFTRKCDGWATIFLLYYSTHYDEKNSFLIAFVIVKKNIIPLNYVWSILSYWDKDRKVRRIRFQLSKKTHSDKRRIVRKRNIPNFWGNLIRLSS